MSNRAEEKALEFYPMKDYNKEPNYIHSCDSKMLDEVYREVFTLGYKQAEKDLGWISVNDRLPEDEGWYLTCVEQAGIPQCVGITLYKVEDRVWLDDYDLIERGVRTIAVVDYWMPIPKLPKEK